MRKIIIMTNNVTYSNRNTYVKECVSGTISLTSFIAKKKVKMKNLFMTLSVWFGW